MLDAESPLLDNLAGRYNDGQANLHLACQAYSGEEVRIDRRGRAPEHLRRPLLTLGLAVQPHVLEALAGNSTMREQGFLARLAFLLPETKLGHRELDPPPVPVTVSAGYERTLRALATLERADTTDTTTGGRGSVGSVSAPSGVRLTLGVGAAAALSELRAALEPRLDPDRGDLASIGAWANRHPGRVARIAGLLHLLDSSASEPIREATMRAAVRIGECLLGPRAPRPTRPRPGTRAAQACRSLGPPALRVHPARPRAGPAQRPRRPGRRRPTRGTPRRARIRPAAPRSGAVLSGRAAAEPALRGKPCRPRRGAAVTSRDRRFETAFLAVAARSHGQAGTGWARHARVRLEAGEDTYGERWSTLGTEALLDELAEEPPTSAPGAPSPAKHSTTNPSTPPPSTASPPRSTVPPRRAAPPTPPCSTPAKRSTGVPDHERPVAPQGRPRGT